MDNALRNVLILPNGIVSALVNFGTCSLLINDGSNIITSILMAISKSCRCPKLFLC